MPAPDLFPPCLAALLHEEGGFSNNPHDRGGMTNLGVTRAAWAAWTHAPATDAIMRGLTPAIVTPLYRVEYWMRVAGDALPVGINLVIFDAAVNTSPQRAARLLQALAGAAQDGHIGPATLEALRRWIAAHGADEAVRRLMAGRRSYYRGLPDFPRFGNGWLNRCDHIQLAALRLLAGD